jgi:hypothetical protein
METSWIWADSASRKLATSEMPLEEPRVIMRVYCGKKTRGVAMMSSLAESQHISYFRLVDDIDLHA